MHIVLDLLLAAIMLLSLILGYKTRICKKSSRGDTVRRGAAGGAASFRSSFCSDLR